MRPEGQKPEEIIELRVRFRVHFDELKKVPCFDGGRCRRK
jgi:hypothetical protein